MGIRVVACLVFRPKPDVLGNWTMASNHRTTTAVGGSRETRFNVSGRPAGRLCTAACLTLLMLFDVTLTRGWTAEPEQETFFGHATAPLLRTDLQLNAAVSCSATACHGGALAGTSVRKAVRGSEYSLWLELDPHARSWHTLCQAESSSILVRLGIMRGGEIVDQGGFDNCLACHNTTREFTEPRSQAPIHEGVGCASCHGPAEKWLSRHYQANWDPASAVQDGYVPAHNLLARARMCATCHVGDRDRDMNHDLIAAGHPPLFYEFSTFQLRMPKHWREESQATASRYEASLWLAGQLAGLDASLALLEARAGQQLPISQWPELSHLDCSACHQPVKLRDVTEQRATRQAGTAPWSAWNNFGVRMLLNQRSLEGNQSQPDQQLAQALESLQATIQARAGTASQAQQAARAARLALDAWIASPQGLDEVAGFSSERLASLAMNAAKNLDCLDNWDRAAQFYLALMAARHSWASAAGAGELRTADASADKLRRLLQFERGLNSPALFFKKPSAAARREWTDALQELIQAVKPLSPRRELNGQ